MKANYEEENFRLTGCWQANGLNLVGGTKGWIGTVRKDPVRRVVGCVSAAALLLAPALLAENTVSNTNNSGAGSLRQALIDAAATSGVDVITFEPALSGQSIKLTKLSEFSLYNSAITIADADGVVLDASNLPGGLTLSGGPTGNYQLFEVLNGGRLTLRGVTLRGGGAGAVPGSGGRSISNRTGGTLTLDRCTISGNSTSFGGGAIENSGTATLTRCAFSGNSASYSSGAMMNTGTATFTHCTFSGNSVSTGSNIGGGAIANIGTATLTHCTVSGNSAANGGGIYNGSGGLLTLANTIVAGNTDTNGAMSRDDIFNLGKITRSGVNIVRSLANDSGSAMVDGSGSIIGADPLLAPLGNYGGTTQTMSLLPGSPARNAAVGSAATGDQRGFPIVGTADIGAYETGTLLGFTAWVYETLPAGSTPGEREPTSDSDGDGRTLLLEYAVFSDGAVPDGGGILSLDRNAAGTQATITFPTRLNASDLQYAIERSTTLTTWTTIFTYNGASNLATPTDGVSTASNEDSHILTDTFIPGKQQVFYRLSVDLIPLAP